MADFQVRVINNITKEYPDMIKVVVYKEPCYFIKTNTTKRSKELVDENYIPKVSSLSRTKATVRDLVLCNDFELFCTFTFDPAKVDSLKLSACWLKMSTWLHHQRDNSREKGIDFKYLIIPEQHKSGRWHFHALISGYTSTLKDTKLKTTNLDPIYNITSFRSGFTTAVRISSKEGVSNYITKYITKDFVTTFNQRRFFCSRNLSRPIKTLNNNIISKYLPLFRRHIYEDDRTNHYLLDKKNLACDNDTSSFNVVQYRVQDNSRS